MKKRLLLVFVALMLALTAVPATAREWDEGYWAGRREEREQRERRERELRERQELRERERGESRRFTYVVPNCYRESGYWSWNGWEHVWVSPRTICQ